MQNVECLIVEGKTSEEQTFKELLRGGQHIMYVYCWALEGNTWTSNRRVWEEGLGSVVEILTDVAVQTSTAGAQAAVTAVGEEKWMI